MKKNNKTLTKVIPQIELAMYFASITKVANRISSVTWTKETLLNAISSEDIAATGVDYFCTRNGLKAVYFRCKVHFEANEVPGIVCPFLCHMQFVVAYNSNNSEYLLVVHDTEHLVCIQCLDGPSWLPSASAFMLIVDKHFPLSLNDLVSADFHMEPPSAPDYRIIPTGTSLEDYWKTPALRALCLNHCVK